MEKDARVQESTIANRSLDRPSSPILRRYHFALSSLFSDRGCLIDGRERRFELSRSMPFSDWIVSIGEVKDLGATVCLSVCLSVCLAGPRRRTFTTRLFEGKLQTLGVRHSQGSNVSGSLLLFCSNTNRYTLLTSTLLVKGIKKSEQLVVLSQCSISDLYPTHRM